MPYLTGLAQVRIVIPIDLFNRLSQFALHYQGGGGGIFTLKQVFLSTSAYNQKVVINGVHVHGTEQVDVNDLSRSRDTVYMVYYRKI